MSMTLGGVACRGVAHGGVACRGLALGGMACWGVTHRGVAWRDMTSGNQLDWSGGVRIHVWSLVAGHPSYFRIDRIQSVDYLSCK